MHTAEHTPPPRDPASCGQQLGAHIDSQLLRPTHPRLQHHGVTHTVSIQDTTAPQLHPRVKQPFPLKHRAQPPGWKSKDPPLLPPGPARPPPLRGRALPPPTYRLRKEVGQERRDFSRAGRRLKSRSLRPTDLSGSEWKRCWMRMGRRGCRHRCFGALAMPWRLRARFNSRDASSPSWTLAVSMRQNWGASGEQGARAVPGRRERLSRSPGQSQEWRRQRGAVHAEGAEAGKGSNRGSRWG